MGSTQPLGEKSQLSQSGYIIFHELDRLFPMWQGKNRRSEDGHQRWQGVVFSSPGQQVSSSDTQESGASHIPRQPARPERTARPGPRVLGRAGQGRAGAGLGRAPQRAPPGRRPRTARASPAPGREARPGTASPRVAGRGYPLPARLPAGQDGPARPVPTPPLLSPRPPAPPRHTCPPRPRQPNLASRLARPRPHPPLLAAPPRSSAPIGRAGTGAEPRPCPR